MPLVAEAKHSAAGAPPALPDRNFIEAVLWTARTGNPWRDLPWRMGCRNHAYVRFRHRERRGVCLSLWRSLQKEAFTEARHIFIESTSVRAHQHAAVAEKNGGDQALGRSRGGLTTKLHAACVDEVSSVGLVLRPGQSADCGRFDELFYTLGEDRALEAAALDKGYDTNAIRDRLSGEGMEAVIPSKSNRREPVAHDKSIYRERTRVERFFQPHQALQEYCHTLREIRLNLHGHG